MRNLAIIPARGGSKRIPGKNIKDFMGKPIIAYSIECALESGLYQEVMVSTDNVEIAEIAKKYGAKVPFIRSETNSNDFATTADVIEEVLQMYRELKIIFDTVTCIYPTAPFVTKEKLQTAFNKLNNNNLSSIFSIVAYSYPIQRGLIINEKERVRMLYPEHKGSRSQDLETIYHDAGQFYISKVDDFTKERSLWGDNTGYIEFSELEVQDLDTETDWKLAELKFSLLHK